MSKNTFCKLFFFFFYQQIIFPFQRINYSLLHGTAQSLLFEVDQIKPRDFRSILQPAATVPAPALGFRLRRGHLGVPVSSAPKTNTHGSRCSRIILHLAHILLRKCCSSDALFSQPYCGEKHIIHIHSHREFVHNRLPNTLISKHLLFHL